MVRANHTEENVASHTLLVRDITSLFDAGHNLFHEARLLTMACEIRQLRAAVHGESRSETVKLREEGEESTG
jgi:hypothetical protein